MPFGVNLSDASIVVAVLFFYLGFTFFSIVLGMWRGEITTKAEILERINPIKSLDVYNQWFLESYKQMKASQDTVAVRNSYFGLLVSSIAILVLWLLVYAIIKIPLGDQPVSQAIAILGSGLFFYAIGGFNAFGAVLGDFFGLIPLPVIGSVTVDDMQRRMKLCRTNSRLKSWRNVS